MSIQETLTELFEDQGVDIFGFASLRELPVEQRDGFDFGIVVGFALDKPVLLGIEDGPTPAYLENYNRLNRRLDALVVLVADTLRSWGFEAQGNTRELVGMGEGDYLTKLPHKTVATRAGIGWIGKCALLVTEGFGAGIRISTILTNAPLTTGRPIDTSRCGPCQVCKDACPAQAVLGKAWHVGLAREEFWDALACAQHARALAWERLHEHITICGLCILKCPWTQRYLKGPAPAQHQPLRRRHLQHHKPHRRPLR
jgi:epoxyqueuosine reductase QueG